MVLASCPSPSCWICALSTRLPDGPTPDDFAQALIAQALSNAVNLAINHNMFPPECNLAIAAACGYVGPNALGRVNRDPATKAMYQALLDAKTVDVRSSLSPCLTAQAQASSGSR